jgi:hypothetical protein
VPGIGSRPIVDRLAKTLTEIDDDRDVRAGVALAQNHHKIIGVGVLGRE